MEGRYPVPRMILIAERDRVVRDLQRHFLTEAGYEVEFVDDGQAALDRLNESAPSLIVTEVMIPKVDGLTLCRRVRENAATRDIPIVVLSVLSAEARAQEAGASAFLRKPLVPAVLVSTIHEAFAARTTNGREQIWASK